MVIDARKAGRTLLFAVVIMNVIAFAVLAFTDATGRDGGELARLFDVADEGNLTAWASALLLLLAAVLLGIIARASKDAGDPDARSWRLLAWVFVYLSLDEAAALHEILIDPVKSATHVSGPFRFAWVFVAIPLLAILGVVLLGFIRRLPTATRRAFIVAGLVFIAGAVGVEVIGGMLVDRGIEPHGLHRILVSIEELLENVGAALFIGALLTYMRTITARTATLEIT